MKVIWYVLVTGCRWEDVPHEMGCSGRTAHRRLQAWEELGIWDRLHAHLLALLRKAGALELETVVVLLRNDELASEFAEIIEGIERVRCHYFFEIKDGQPQRLGHLLVDTINPEDQLLKRVGEAVKKRSGNEKFRELVRARAFYCVIVTGDEKKAQALASAAQERQATHGLSVAVETHVISDLFDIA